jgi:hypothetical protein
MHERRQGLLCFSFSRLLVTERLLLNEPFCGNEERAIRSEQQDFVEQKNALGGKKQPFPIIPW